MTHILIAGKLHPSGLDLLNAAKDVTYDYVEDITEESYRPLIHKADALVIRTQPLSAATLAQANRLKLVSRHGVGFDAVDLEALNARGIPLSIVGDVNSVSVAEHSMMLLMAAAKRAVLAHKSLTENNWGWRTRLEAVELHGKKLLIVGYGRIGRHLARMASTFGMEIRASDPFLEKHGWPPDAVAKPIDLLAGLAWADMVSINAPKSDRPLLGSEEFAQLKPGAIVVNTARGGVVDESALIAALKSGQVAAAGVDVFEDEPPPKTNELFRLDQVILSPHVAGLTVEAAERTAVSSVQNALDFFNGSLDRKLIVNAPEIDGSAPVAS